MHKKKQISYIKLINMIEKNNGEFLSKKYDGILKKYKYKCNLNHEWETTANSIINNKSWCPKCAGVYMDKKFFIEKAIKVHDNKYDYSLSNYKRSNIKVNILCSKHGFFRQAPNHHLQGQGCPKCGGSTQLNINEFKFKANKIHNNKYDYSLSKYINSHKKIKIVCPKHGVFQQKPTSHLNNSGCPICNESKGEKRIRNYLTNKNILFERQKKFNNCKNKRKLSFDFYLPEHNLLIEYDGEQHYKPIERFGGENGFKKIKNYDKIKNKYVKNMCIDLIRISYLDFYNIKNILNKYLLKSER